MVCLIEKTLKDLNFNLNGISNQSNQIIVAMLCRLWMILINKYFISMHCSYSYTSRCSFWINTLSFSNSNWNLIVMYLMHRYIIFKRHKNNINPLYVLLYVIRVHDHDDNNELMYSRDMKGYKFRWEERIVVNNFYDMIWLFFQIKHKIQYLPFEDTIQTIKI